MVIRSLSLPVVEDPKAPNVPLQQTRNFRARGRTCERDLIVYLSTDMDAPDSQSRNREIRPERTLSLLSGEIPPCTGQPRHWSSPGWACPIICLSVHVSILSITIWTCIRWNCGTSAKTPFLSRPRQEAVNHAHPWSCYSATLSTKHMIMLLFVWYLSLFSNNEYTTYNSNKQRNTQNIYIYIYKDKSSSSRSRAPASLCGRPPPLARRRASAPPITIINIVIHIIIIIIVIVIMHTIIIHTIIIIIISSSFDFIIRNYKSNTSTQK